MKMGERIGEYFRLLRIQTGAATAIGPLIAGLVMGQTNPLHLSILFLIGIFSHIFVFVLNEVIDIEVDRTSKDLKKKPLVSGLVSRNHALYIVFLSCSASYILTIVFFPSVYTFGFLTIALVLSSLYDLFGKQIPGSDFLLASGYFFLCIFGASAISINFTMLIYIVCFSCFLHIVFNNAIEGGLKDVDHDSLAGAKTTATRLGVKVRRKKLRVTKRFITFAVSIKSIYIGMIILLGFQPEIKLWNSQADILQFLIILLIVVVYLTMYKFLSSDIFNRTKLIRLFSIHEMSSYFLAPLIILPLIDIGMVFILLFIPFIWYIIFNILLYGTVIKPQV